MTRSQYRGDESLALSATVDPKSHKRSRQQPREQAHREPPICPNPSDADALASALTFGAVVAFAGLLILWILSRFSSEISACDPSSLKALPFSAAVFAPQHRAIAVLKMSGLFRLLYRSSNSATDSGRYLQLTLR
jgi:hypothetical protein